MSFLEKSVAAFAGYKGLKGGVKAAAALAVGQWAYRKWQSSRQSRATGGPAI